MNQHTVTSNTQWQQDNLAHLHARLKWLLEKPEGVIFRQSSGQHEIAIVKTNGTHLHLVFVDPTSQEIASRFDLIDPLYLLAPYSQAVMLSLAWIKEPKSLYVLGLGGGRIPLIFHHYFPQIIIDSTETDAQVVEVAQKYFGVEFDDRSHVYVEDGRQFLEQKTEDQHYEIILVDAAHGNGYSPYNLATAEFFSLCRQKLAADGVVVVNILPTDSLYFYKIKTLAAIFRTVYRADVSGTNIFIATDAPRKSRAELLQAAAEIQAQHQFSFPFLETATKVFPTEEVDLLQHKLTIAQILTDAQPPANYFDNLSTKSTVFAKAKANDVCPCGSGKKFQECHGRSSLVI